MMVLFAIVVTLALWGEVKCCSNEINVALQTGKVYEFLSFNVISEGPGTSHTCVFEGYAPYGQKISVLCHPLSIMYDRDCKYAKFLYSPSGDTNYADAVTYCGYRQSLIFTTATNRVALKFINTVPEDVNLPGYYCYVGTPPPTLVRTTATIRTPTTATSTQAPSVSNCDCGFEYPAPRVVGGGAASTAEYPWMVGIANRGIDDPFCGGSLISNQWVLTAAHCMKDEAMENVEVVLGTNTFGLNGKSGRRVNVSLVIIHPYSGINLGYDIALLKLAARVTYSNRISPVCLPFNLQHSDYEGTYGTVTGWGRASVQGESSKVLKEVNLRIINNKECTFYYRGKEYLAITDNIVCTLRTDGQSGCDGDSGGPLTVQSKGRHFQLGIVMGGLQPCTDPLHPGLYEKVANHLQWIEYNTRETFCRAN